MGGLTTAVRRAALLALVASVPLLAGWASSEGGRTVTGANGSTLRFAWTAGHMRVGRAPGGDWNTTRIKIDVAVDSRKNVYLLDRYATKRLGRRGFVLFKYGPDGRILWTIRQRPSSPERLQPQAVTVDTSDNVWVLTTARLKERGVGAYVQKFSPDGRRLASDFQLMVPRPASGGGFMLAADAKSGIYAAGTVETSSAPGTWIKPWLARYGNDGRLEWQRLVTPADVTGEALELTVADGRATVDVVGYTIVRQTNSAGATISEQSTAYHQLISYDGAGTGRRVTTVPVDSPLPRAAGGRPLLGAEQIMARGPYGHIYAIAGQALDIWVEIRKGDGVVLRAAIDRASEGRPTDRLDAQRLFVDEAGDAYVVIANVWAKRKPTVIRLHKLDVSLP